MISTGEPSPPGKCSSNFSWPTTESAVPVNDSVVEMPSDLSWKENAASTTSKTAVIHAVGRGCLSTVVPTLAQKPLSWAFSSSNFGIFGQKIHRPKITSSAGKKVNTVTIADAIPIAPTGPKPRLLESSLNNKTSRPAITVLPEAIMGSITPRSAIPIDSNREP